MLSPSNWTSMDMKKCLTAIANGMGFNAASREFSIPKPTIRRHRLGMNKYANAECKHHGAPCVLPKELEEELVQHIKQLDELTLNSLCAHPRQLPSEE